MSTWERMQAVAASKQSSFTRSKDFFLRWEDGERIIRLVGDFVEMRTHYIAPSSKSKDKGICPKVAFEGADRLPLTVNCTNWDLASEHAIAGAHCCPICRLYDLADSALKSGKVAKNTPEYEYYETLRHMARVRKEIKWNVIDRNSPEITITGEDGVERRVPGLKVATFSPELQSQLWSKFQQVKCDLNDPENGFDLRIERSMVNGRIGYKCDFLLDGTSLMHGPLTEEERGYEIHNIKMLLGRPMDVEKVMNSMHGDFRDILAKYDAKYGFSNEPVKAAEQTVAAVAAASSPVEAPAAAVSVDKHPPKTTPAPTPYSAAAASSTENTMNAIFNEAFSTSDASVLDALPKRNDVAPAEDDDNLPF